MSDDAYGDVDALEFILFRVSIALITCYDQGQFKGNICL